jgi:hypothetical protein
MTSEFKPEAVTRPPLAAIYQSKVAFGFSDSDGAMKQRCAQPGNVRTSVIEQNLSRTSRHAHR